ncbi:MAG: ATP-binding cassette domain-containing protein [Solirubrobacteraceae bacterium]
MLGAPLFAFESLSVGPPGARRLDGLEAELAPGGLTVVAGPSGSGKSTLLRLCNRLEVPSAGTVRHRGIDVAERDPLTLRREVAMVFQRPVTFAGSRTLVQTLMEHRTLGSGTVILTYRPARPYRPCGGISLVPTCSSSQALIAPQTAHVVRAWSSAASREIPLPPGSSLRPATSDLWRSRCTRGWSRG